MRTQDATECQAGTIRTRPQGRTYPDQSSNSGASPGSPAGGDGSSATRHIASRVSAAIIVTRPPMLQATAASGRGTTPCGAYRTRCRKVTVFGGSSADPALLRSRVRPMMPSTEGPPQDGPRQGVSPGRLVVVDLLARRYPAAHPKPHGRDIDVDVVGIFPDRASRPGAHGLMFPSGRSLETST